MLCFCHMIKTAGTTFSYILRNNYGFNYTEIEKNISCNDLKLLRLFNPKLIAISGHTLRPTMGLERVSGNIRYITFFRNPIERYISHYNHGLVYGNSAISLDERLKCIGEADYQTKFILGAQSREDRSYHANEKHLEEAKYILENKYDFVGLVENFDESLIMMNNLLNLPGFDLRYRRRNVNTSNKANTIAELDPVTVKKLRNANSIDLKLYSYVMNELFQKQKNSVDYNLEYKIINLQRECQQFTFPFWKNLAYRIGKYLFYRPLLKASSILK